MDFYFQTYPEDENIVSACVDLVYSTFKAAEQAIVFYTSHQGLPFFPLNGLFTKLSFTAFNAGTQADTCTFTASRAGSAIIKADTYRAELLESLSDMKASATTLQRQAEMSFNYRVITGTRFATPVPQAIASGWMR